VRLTPGITEKREKGGGGKKGKKGKGNALRIRVEPNPSKPKYLVTEPGWLSVAGQNK